MAASFCDAAHKCDVSMLALLECRLPASLGEAGIYMNNSDFGFIDQVGLEKHESGGLIAESHMYTVLPAHTPEVFSKVVRQSSLDRINLSHQFSVTSDASAHVKRN